MAINVVFTCVTEPTKKFLDQSARLLMSLRWFGGSLADARFVLGCTGPVPSDAVNLFLHYRAEIVTIARYDASHGPSNKIPLLASPVLSGHDLVVLIDCDTVIVQDPGPVLDVAGVAAKIADLPSVSLADLQAIFRHAERPMPQARYTHELTGDPTIAYCNSGVIVVREEYRLELAAEWDRWNRVLLDAPGAVPFHRFHADQASLTLAIEDSGIPFSPLPTEMNMPGHFEEKTYPAAWHERDPIIIHYHWLAYANGFLKPNPLLQCSRRIESFNARLRAERHTATPSDFLSRRKTGGERPKVVVGSGWWCDDTARDWTLGLVATRSIAFFDVWFRQIMRCLNPDRVVITDSASPVKPDYRSYGAIEWIELDRNYGHANDLRTGTIQTKYCGFTRSVMNGAMYALCCDADVYVYVEQDCLLFGEDLLAAALGDSTSDVLLGCPAENAKGLNGAVAAPMLQQSLMIVRRTGLERFLQGLLGAPWTDGECSPEETMRRRLAPYDFIHIPYGRSRPIDFTRSHFYAQHLEMDELEQLLQRMEAGLPTASFAFRLADEGCSE